MNIPNVNCKIRFFENEDTLSKNKIRQENYGEARKFYSCNTTQDYLTYVDTGSQQTIDYIDYSGNKEKSSGVFNAKGLLVPSERKQLRENLRKTKSIIWDCLLTFQPEFGQKYCNDYEAAHDLMKKEFPRFLKDAGFKVENITWYAGLHTNKKHRHIHISFFENQPTRFRQRVKTPQFSLGKISRTCIERFKLRAELKLTDISSQIKIARSELSAITKNVLFSKESNLKYNNEFHSGVIRLLENLPREGRLTYDSENMQHFKPQIIRLIDVAMKINKPWYEAFTNFCSEVGKVDIITREILIASKVPQKLWGRHLKADVYLEDMYRRLGNQILNYVRAYKKKEKPTASRLAQKRIRQKTALDLLAKSASIQAAIEVDAMMFFIEYLRKLDEAKQINEREDEMDEMA